MDTLSDRSVPNRLRFSPSACALVLAFAVEQAEVGALQLELEETKLEGEMRLQMLAQDEKHSRKLEFEETLLRNEEVEMLRTGVGSRADFVRAGTFGHRRLPRGEDFVMVGMVEGGTRGPFHGLPRASIPMSIPPDTSVTSPRITTHTECGGRLNPDKALSRTP